MGVPIGEEREKEIITAYLRRQETDETLDVMLERMGIAKTTLFRVLKRNGVEKVGQRTLLEGNEEEVVKQYHAGASITDLANQYGASHETMRKELGKRGINTAKKLAYTPEEIAQWIQWYEEGYSAGQIAVMTEGKVSDDIIIRALEKHNIQMHPTIKPIAGKYQEIIARHGQGESVDLLTEDYGVDKLTIENIIDGNYHNLILDTKSMGVQLRERIARRYASGDSASMLAAEFTLTDDTIRSYAKEFNISTAPVRKYDFNTDAFTDLTPEALYWLGFITADGSIMSEGKFNKLRIGLQEGDRGHLEKFCKWMGGPVSMIKESKSTNSCYVIFCSKDLVFRLKEYGIVPRKSFIDISLDPRLTTSTAFWRGVVDGDGSIIINKNGYPVISMCGGLSVMQYFTDWTSAILDCPVTKRLREGDTTPFYVSSISGPKAQYVLKLFGESCDTYLDRKEIKRQQALSYVIKNPKWSAPD